MPQVQVVRAGHVDDRGEFVVGHLEHFRVVGRIVQLDRVQHWVAAEPLEEKAILQGTVVAQKMHFIEAILVQQAFQRPWLSRRRLRRVDPLQRFLLLAGRQGRRHCPQVGMTDPGE